jgi:hypothetical protein
MSYLALANHIKLYNSDGKLVSLYDAYTTELLSDSEGNTLEGKRLALKDTYFKDKESIDKYNDLNAIL